MLVLLQSAYASQHIHTDVRNGLNIHNKLIYDYIQYSCVRLYLDFWTNVHTSISPQMDMDRHVSTNVHAVTC